MIKTIEIRNFKSHKHTQLELSQGVNIIVGDTDSGKSAIIQALKWLVFNRPSGDSFRSNWGGDTFVEVDLEKDVVGSVVTHPVSVTRFKSDENAYLLGDKEKWSDIFKAIKTDVPDEIKQALNLNEINLQSQFESHFLLSKSPGEVAQHFNKVAHLDKIDVGLFNIQKWIRDLQSKMKYDDIKMGDLVDNLLGYDNLPVIEKKIKKLENIDNKQNKLSSSIAECWKVLHRIMFVEEGIEEELNYTKADKLVTGLLKDLESLRIWKRTFHNLDELLIGIKDTESEILEIEETIPMGKIVDDLLKIEEQRAQAYYQKGKIEFLIFEVSVEVRNQKTLENEILKMEKQFHKYLGKGKECPLCGSIIK